MEGETHRQTALICSNWLVPIHHFGNFVQWNMLNQCRGDLRSDPGIGIVWGINSLRKNWRSRNIYKAIIWRSSITQNFLSNVSIFMMWTRKIQNKAEVTIKDRIPEFSVSLNCEFCDLRIRYLLIWHSRSTTVVSINYMFWVRVPMSKLEILS